MKTVPASEPGETATFGLGRVLNLLASPGGQLVIILILSLLYRMNTFGHPNMHDDETFYFLVGQEMHRGALPYVDIWDRKPLGLFLIYYLIAGISSSVLAYQIVAWLCVALTGWIIALIVAEMSNRRGGLMAGLSYVALLPLFLGWGGQAPIFYNLPVACAALLVIKALPALREGKAPRLVDLAMLLCGLAITVKQTTIFESAFFGLFCAVALVRSPTGLRRAVPTLLRWMLIGALPTLLISLYYFLAGHWEVYWSAMVVSNLAKQQTPLLALAGRGLNAYVRVLPLACTAVIGLVLAAHGPNAGKYRRFLFCWLVAAWLGYFIVPNMYTHYLLPVLVPLCVASGLLFSRRDLGLIFFLILSITSLGRYQFWSYAYTKEAQLSIASMTRAIKAHDGGRGLLIYDGPLLLYSFSGNRPMSPLAFPPHLNYAIEADVSHLNTAGEVAKILARQPGAVVMSRAPRNRPFNATTLAMVRQYVETNCRLVDEQWSSEMFHTHRMQVYGDCAKPSRRAPAP